MCGRFTRTMSWREIYELYRLTVERETDFKRENFKPRYNVAPTQDIPILRQPDGEPEMAIARWGLGPALGQGREERLQDDQCPGRDHHGKGLVQDRGE